MGCSDCSRSGGCDTRKSEERVLLDDVMARIYGSAPVWGRPDDEARFRAGVSTAEARRLGRAIAEHLKAPTFYRPGGPDDLCDFLWVLCVGRRPALVDVRDGVEAWSGEAERVSERYLRVALSSVGRLAAVQEVELALEVDGSGDGDAASPLVVERPRAGIYDPTLLKRTRALTSLLAASDIAYLDFGLLDVPVENADAADYAERFGVPPRLANFLFFAAPPTTAATTLLAA